MTSNTGQNGSCRRWRGYEARSSRGGKPWRPRGIRSPRDLRRRSPVRGRSPDPSTDGPCGGRGAGGAGSRLATASLVARSGQVRRLAPSPGGQRVCRPGPTAAALVAAGATATARRLHQRRHRFRRRSGTAGAGIQPTEARAAGSGRPSLLQRILGRRDSANARHPRGDRQVTTSLRDRGDACGARSRRAAAGGRQEQDCVMATDERIGESISTWLEQTAPPRLPERVLEATFERTRRSRQQVGWRARLGGVHMPRFVPALGSAAVVVVAAAVALNFYVNRPSIGGPVFQGTWVSTTDADGGTQAMTVRGSADGAVEIVVTDDVASVCSGGPSTMTGTGKLEGSTVLVIPSPTFTCDDGSEPKALSGPPLQEQLRNLTFVLDPEAETLTDNFGGLWLREGAEVPSPRPTISGGMWPQTSLEEVRQAQERANAGDPAYTWQVDPQLTSQESDPLLTDPELWSYFTSGGAEIVERFLREELGWDEFLFSGEATALNADGLRGLVYLRCAPGETNPLWPIAPVHPKAPRGDLCAPTINELRYEAVRLDLFQPDRR